MRTDAPFATPQNLARNVDKRAKRWIARRPVPRQCATELRHPRDRNEAQVPHGRGGGRLDVFLYLGGDCHLAMIEDEAHLGWLRERKSRVPLMTSVCTGSVVFAAAGLLRGRPATSHRNSLDHMVSIDPTIEPRPGVRFVDDGDVITASGLSAGIDMALHVVGRLAGPERARQVREGINYAPDPPVLTAAGG
jgi:transcriptional regulator GlxA family with amidase domain